MSDTGETILRGRLARRDKLDFIIETMREMSLQTDPQAMVEAYILRMEELLPVQRRISLSRRDLMWPCVRITRYSGWDPGLNPWKEKDRLPVLKGGLLGELIYANEPRIIDELQVGPDDPAAEYLDGQRSLMAFPLFDEGESLNMVAVTRDDPAGF